MKKAKIKKQKNKNMDEPKKELVPVEAPQLVVGPGSVKQASKIAKELTGIINKQELFTVIQGRKFINVEGWNTLGAMLGVFPEVTKVEKLPEHKVSVSLVEIEYYDRQTRAKKTYQKFMRTEFVKGQKVIEEREVEEVRYQATVQLNALNGTKITQAQAICSSLEEGKLEKDEYSILSMAETRATGKAFRLAFSWIVKMAGYEPTPAEEAGAAVDTTIEPLEGGERPTVENGLRVKPKQA